MLSIGQSVLTIISSSLFSGEVPAKCKCAAVQPLPKKPGLDHAVLAHYKPIISCSSFIMFSKYLVEEYFQMSTKSASVRVSDNILLACDSGNHVVLVLRDLTAVLNTADQNILKSRLHHSVGT